MSRSKKIYVLLGVLLVVCAATLGVSRYEACKEEIKNSDEVILKLASEDVNSLKWEYESEETGKKESLAFHRDDTWMYDDDEAFPVSEEKIDELLEPFASFGVSFIIENVEDYGQYGLDDPVCTIQVGTDDKTYAIKVGDYSKMDEQRYVSIDDGNVYLVPNDPMDLYGLELKDMIQNDEIPEFDKVSEIEFAGEQDYTVVYKEENDCTYSADDVYFTQKDGAELPLDTSAVNSYLSTISGLDSLAYVSYNATDEDVASYGLDDPELSVTIQYTTKDEESEEEKEDTFVLHVSRDPEEKEKAAKEEDKETSDESSEEDDRKAYVRVGDSRIIYEVNGTQFDALMASSYNDLRHQELIWADFADITQIDISLDGKDYTFTSKEKKDEKTWYYDDEELEITDFQDDLMSLKAAEFTDEHPDGKQEISFTIHLDNENVQEVSMELYRYDGEHCLAIVDGEPVSLVDRSSVVDVVEAVNEIVLSHVGH